MEKTCTRCKQSKPLDAFRKDKRYRLGVNSWCKECYRERAKEWGRKNRKKKAEIQRRYRKRHPERPAGVHLKAKYGITLEEYKAMLNAQGQRCAICGMHQRDAERRFSVDHCHETGEVRALLCIKCNAGIGSLNDDPEMLLTALGYLLEHKEKEHGRPEQDVDLCLGGCGSGWGVIEHVWKFFPGHTGIYSD